MDAILQRAGQAVDCVISYMGDCRLRKEGKFHKKVSKWFEAEKDDYELGVVYPSFFPCRWIIVQSFHPYWSDNLIW